MSNIIIEKIIDIERRAQRIMDEAKGQKEGLDAYLENEEKRISREYAVRAERKVEQIQHLEEENARQRLEQIKQQTEQQKAQLLSIYKKNHEVWLSELYTRITGQAVKND